MNTYREFYEKEVKSALIRRFQYKNVMEVPKIVKITVNIGLGEALQNIKALDAASVRRRRTRSCSTGRSPS